jgi:phosphinothricin acetyltransferase
MRAEDAAAVARIYNEGIAGRGATFETEPRGPQEVAEWARGADVPPALVAARGAEVVGWARVTPYSDRQAYAGVGECGIYVGGGSRPSAAPRRARTRRR